MVISGAGSRGAAHGEYSADIYREEWNCGFDYRAQLESQDMRISEVQIDVLAFDPSTHEFFFIAR
jgi:hypothetical protein